MTSVIIRLQNLPWSANALDIRKFFVGLCIPDGGVHIVGGEMGDAFIAFSTDEDARRSMMLDRGKINQTQIRLYLSSRAEMQTVIENARNNSIQIQLNAALPDTTNNEKTITRQSPLVTSNSMQNIMSRNQSSLTTIADKSSNEFSSIRKARERDRKPLRRRDSRSSSTSSESHRSRSRRSRDSKKLRSSRNSSSRDRSRDRNRVRESRRSRDSASSDQSRRSSSYESIKKRGNDQEKQIRSRKSEMLTSGTYNQHLSSSPGLKSYDLTIESDIEKQSCEERNQFGKENLVKTQTKTNPVTTMRSLPYFQHTELSGTQNKYSNCNNYLTSKDSSSDLIENKTRNVNHSLNSSHFRSFNLLSSLLPRTAENKSSIVLQNPYNPINKPTQNTVSNWEATTNTLSQNYVNNREYQSLANLNTKERNPEIINSPCVKILNMVSTTSYNDIRRFFTGIVIPQKGIKIINNNHGNRVGIAYVNFCKPELALRAMSFNHNYLKSQKVNLVKVLYKEFEEAIDSFRPPYRNIMQDQQQSTNLLKNTQIASTNQVNNPLYNRNNVNKNEIHVKNEIPLTVLRLEDLPPFAREQDVMKMFGSYTILDIIITRTTDKEYVAFVKFHRSEDAKTALNDRSHHLIGHRQICAKPSTEIELERAREEKNKLIQKEMMDDEVKEKAKKIEIEMEMEIERSRFITSVSNFEQPNDDNLTIDSDNKQIQSPKENDCESNNNIGSPINKINEANIRLNTLLQTENLANKNQNTSNSNEGGIPSLLTLDSTVLSIDSSFQNRPRFIDNFTNMPGYLLLRNLDYKVVNRDIGEYFVSQNVIPMRVEILMNNRGTSSGDAIIEFASVEIAQNALKINNRILNGRIIHFEIVTRDAIDRRLGVNFLRADTNINNRNSNNIRFGMVDNQTAFGNRNGFHGTYFFNKNRFGNGNIDGNINENFGRARQGFNINGRNNKLIDSDHSPPSKNIPEEFTRSGSVLVLENVPYKATINDIIEFFVEFNITGSDIIRRYNDNGTPTGDARVDFKTPELARSALESKKGKKIQNRTIFLKLL